MTKKSMVILIVVSLVMVALLVACTSATQAPAAPAQAPAAPAQKADGASLLETRCSVCHSADRPKQAKKTRDQWNQTVTRMMGKGAQLTDAEKTVLLDYLAKTYGP
jgi:cytochrome c5